jgi:hypothetical protein
MFRVDDRVQIYNHDEEYANGQYGTVVYMSKAYTGDIYYEVLLDDICALYTCTEDELIEG